MSNEKKIILIAHCLLAKGFVNSFSNEMSEITRILLDSETGIIQMPCPHLFSLVNGDTQKNASGNVKNSCYAGFFEEMKNGNPEDLYSGIIDSLVMQITEYKHHNISISGIIGVKNSPICGVNNQIVKNKLPKKHGIFMDLLNKRLKDKKITINMTDIEVPWEERKVHNQT